MHLFSSDYSNGDVTGFQDRGKKQNKTILTYTE